MDLILNILGWILMLGGGAFVLVGGVGVLRFPDMYTRLHAASVTETLGAGLLILGMLLHSGSWLVAVKLILLGVFLFATGPTAAHALARTALEGGLKPKLWGTTPQSLDSTDISGEDADTVASANTGPGSGASDSAAEDSTSKP